MTRRLWLWNRIATCVMLPMKSSATQSPVQLLKQHNYHSVLSSPINFVSFCSPVALWVCWILSVLETWSRTCPSWDSGSVGWYLHIRVVRCVEKRMMVLKSIKPSILNCHTCLSELKNIVQLNKRSKHFLCWRHAGLKSRALIAKWCRCAKSQKNNHLFKV